MQPTVITKDLFTAKATTGVSKAHLVEGLRNVVVHFISEDVTTATVKVKGSIVDNVDFTAASSPSNPWFWIATTPLDVGSTPVDGNTGYSSSSGFLNKAVELETNLIRWFAVEITAISAGSVSATFIASSNE